MGGPGGVLIDIDGVLVTAWSALPGAADALTRLRAGNVPFLLATNTTSMSRDGLAARLRDTGIDVGSDEVVTAPAITASFLRAHHPGARCHILGQPQLGADFEGIELVERSPDVVVVAGADPAFTWENLSAAFRMVREGAELVAMHRNLSWLTESGLMLDAGGFLVGLERASGKEAVVTGKPSPAFFRECVGTLGLEPERVAMVGDDLETDVLAAQDAGLRGVLVRTGKFLPETLERSPRKPDAVIDSIANLPELLS
jgi:HAD superfamily hydrolase (TIGR01458 family)